MTTVRISETSIHLHTLLCIEDFVAPYPIKQIPKYRVYPQQQQCFSKVQFEIEQYRNLLLFLPSVFIIALRNNTLFN